jgi:hypothetical protein
MVAVATRIVTLTADTRIDLELSTASTAYLTPDAVHPIGRGLRTDAAGRGADRRRLGGGIELSHWVEN